MKRTINNIIEQRGETIVKRSERLKEGFNLEKCFQRLQKIVGENKRVTWTDISTYDKQHNNCWTSEQKLALHDRSFRNS